MKSWLTIGSTRAGTRRLLAAVAALAFAASQPAPGATPLGACRNALSAPARIAAAPDGSLYVTEPDAGRVVVFDMFGRVTDVRSPVARPLGIAIDGEGHIYLGDATRGSVGVYDAEWNPLYELGTGLGEFQLPNHIAVDGWSESNTVYISDSRANFVGIYCGAARTGRFGSPGTGDGQFDFPAGVCVSSAGEVYVADQNNDRVEVFDRAGAFLRSFRLKTGGMATGPTGRAQALAIDAENRLYVSDTFQGIVKVFNATNGTFLSRVGSFGEAFGQLRSPAGLALDVFNRLHAASTGNGRVEMFGIDSFLHFVAPPEDAVASGAVVEFRVMASEPAGVTFQWTRDGAPIDRETNATLALSDLQLGDSGGYAVRVSGEGVVITSSVAQVTVLEPPSILSDPYSRVAMAGETVNFSLIADGSGLTLQWQFNGSDLPGETNDVLSLDAVQLWQTGDYGVRVANAVGALTSATAHLRVLVEPTVLQFLGTAGDAEIRQKVVVDAEPGQPFALDASPDLAGWTTVTNFVTEAGIYEYVPPFADTLPGIYYRARWTP
jgi:DNA-binding beta-propeller fold protein YncE